MPDDNSNERNKRVNQIVTKLTASVSQVARNNVIGQQIGTLEGRSEADLIDIERRLGGRVS